MNCTKRINKNFIKQFNQNDIKNHLKQHEIN